MTEDRPIVVSIRDVTKDYRGLRPLRVRALDIREGESVALLGFDQAAAEVLVNLITAATVPDSGEVLVFGQPTFTIADVDTWLRSLDRFGIVSERAVILDSMSVQDNLTMPLTMDLEDVPAMVRARVRELAHEVGLGVALLDKPVGSLSAAEQLRLRLGRALAPNPNLLLAEHPNALVPAGAVAAFAADYARIVSERRVTSLVVTADRNFATSVAHRVLALQPATGEFKPLSMWSRWFA